MTETAFRAFPDAGVVALFDEAPGGGDPTDINSPRNRPALSPAGWLANVYFHTALDNMEVALDVMSPTISHPAIAALPGGSGVLGQVDAGKTAGFSYAPVDYELYTHNLGYIPLVYVAIGNQIVAPGYSLQASAGADTRFISVYVTTTKVFLRECAIRGESGLAAINQQYRVLVIRAQPAASGNKLIEFNPATGIVTMGRNRFDSSRRYLQVVPGGTPFGVATGRTMDAKKGAPRFVAADGTIRDPIPADLVLRVNALTEANGPWGPSMAYDGSFTGDPVYQVQAP